MSNSGNFLGVAVAVVILADISADTFCSAGGFCCHRAFVIVSCSRDWLGVGVAAVILADIGTNAVLRTSGGLSDSTYIIVAESTIFVATFIADSARCTGGCSTEGMGFKIPIRKNMIASCA